MESAFLAEFKYASTEEYTPAWFDVGTPARHLGGEPLGEFTAGVITVPVECLGQQQALGALDPDRMDVGDLREDASELLLRGHAELGRLLDAIDEVGAGVGEGDDVGT